MDFVKSRLNDQVQENKKPFHKLHSTRQTIDRQLPNQTQIERRSQMELQNKDIQVQMQSKELYQKTNSIKVSLETQVSPEG